MKIILALGKNCGILKAGANQPTKNKMYKMKSNWSSKENELVDKMDRAAYCAGSTELLDYLQAEFDKKQAAAAEAAAAEAAAAEAATL
jgi:hypothetical protein